MSRQRPPSWVRQANGAAVGGGERLGGATSFDQARTDPQGGPGLVSPPSSPRDRVASGLDRRFPDFEAAAVGVDRRRLTAILRKLPMKGPPADAALSSAVVAILTVREILTARHGWRYLQIFGAACAYCGRERRHFDHVPALSAVDGIPAADLDSTAFLLVPACKACNGVLGSRPITRFADRKAYLRARFARPSGRVRWRDLGSQEALHSFGFCDVAAVAVERRLRELAAPVPPGPVRLGRLLGLE